MRFTSKKDRWLGILLWFSMIGGLILVINSGSGTGSLVMVLANLFVGVIWFGTRYVIVHGVLYIYCGPLCRRIPISDIKRVKRTNNPLSSPALSLDRLEIEYGKDRVIIISPAERDVFIETLKRENEAIEIYSRVSDDV